MYKFSYKVFSIYFSKYLGAGLLTLFIKFLSRYPSFWYFLQAYTKLITINTTFVWQWPEIWSGTSCFRVIKLEKNFFPIKIHFNHNYYKTVTPSLTLLVERELEMDIIKKKKRVVWEFLISNIFYVLFHKKRCTWAYSVVLQLKV